MSLKPVVIIAAVPQELAVLVASLHNRTESDHQAFPVIDGLINNQRVICCTAGVGKSNAAAATAALLERYQPRLIINTGCCGAYPDSGLMVGDLAVATDEVFGDEGVMTNQGWLGLEEMGIALLKQATTTCFNSIPLSASELRNAAAVAETHRIHLRQGVFVTVSSCSGTRLGGIELSGRYQAICENMEGAAIALTALRYGAPCLEIRGVSNLVEDRDMSRWDIKRAVEAAQQFVLKLLDLKI